MKTKIILGLITFLFFHSESFSQNLSISGGYKFSQMMCGNGRAYGFGMNDNGQVGDNTQGTPGNDRLSPTPVRAFNPSTGTVTAGNISNLKQVDAGSGAHAVGLTTGDSVVTWGGNWKGQLGDGTGNWRFFPGYVNGIGGVGKLAGVNYVSGGDVFSMAIRTSDGAVYTWGGNERGQLGNSSIGTGNTGQSNNPVIVGASSATATTTTFNGVIQVEGGDDYSLALKNNGTVWSWGWNNNGQLGDGSTTDRLTPVQVLQWTAPGGPAAPLTGVIAISAGDIFNYALKSDGTVWGWGSNFEGELGLGGYGCAGLPCSPPCDCAGKMLWAVQMKNPSNSGFLTGAIKIAAGNQTGAVLLNTGEVVAMGLNNTGQVGRSGTNGYGGGPNLPVYVRNAANTANLTGISNISDGDNWFFAVNASGQPFVWGENTNGQLGIGNTTNQTTAQTLPLPVGCTVPLPVDFIYFHAKANHQDEVVLNWQTSTEKNNDYFIIEKSTDGINFEEIGRVYGKGNSNTLQSYYFTDNVSRERICYYRLVQIDFDGKENFSAVKSVSFQNQSITVYPNPGKGVFYIQSAFSTGAVTILDLLGQVVLQTNEGVQEVDLSAFPSGIYFIRIKLDESEWIEKIVKE